MILRFRHCSYYVNNFICDTDRPNVPDERKTNVCQKDISLLTRRPNDWAELAETQRAKDIEREVVH